MATSAEPIMVTMFMELRPGHRVGVGRFLARMNGIKAAMSAISAIQMATT